MPRSGYVQYSDDWWDTEVEWIEQRAKMPTNKQLDGFYSQSTFRSYVLKQMIHCGVNGPKSCTERLEAVYEKLMGRQEGS